MLTRTLPRRTAALLAVPALLLSACAADSTTVGSDGAEVGATSELSPDAAELGDASDGTAQSTGEGTTVASAVSLGVATAPDGSTFTIGDFAGQQVFVETFATWCSSCRRQLEDTQVAAAQAGDGAVFLALSIETSLDPAELEAYAQQHGFTDIRFGVLEPEALAALDEEFGSKVLNAPSTPKFTVAADGTLSAMTTGPESVEEILSQLGA